MSGPIQKQNGSQRIRGPRLEVFVQKNPSGRVLPLTQRLVLGGSFMVVSLPEQDPSADFGVPFIEGLAKANSENRVIASNRKIGKALAEYDDNKLAAIAEAFYCWTGTIVAYEEPGRMLGNVIVFSDPHSKRGFKWAFPVPEEFRGMVDIALVAEHPHFSLEKDAQYIFVHADVVGAVPNFPSSDGKYHGDPIYGIPTGKEETGENSLYFYRTDKIVAPVARAIHNNCEYIKECVILDRPSKRRGMLVEASDIQENVLLENGLISAQLVAEYIGNLRNLITLGAADPVLVKFSVLNIINTLVFDFRQFGLQCPPLKEASFALGEFVTKDLQDPRYSDLVPELKKYFIQKIKEVPK